MKTIRSLVALTAAIIMMVFASSCVSPPPGHHYELSPAARQLVSAAVQGLVQPQHRGRPNGGGQVIVQNNNGGGGYRPGPVMGGGYPPNQCGPSYGGGDPYFQNYLRQVGPIVQPGMRNSDGSPVYPYPHYIYPRRTP